MRTRSRRRKRSPRRTWRRSRPSWPFRRPSGRPRTPVFKIATWNVNGIRAREAQIHEWIARERPDVVCFQELKAAPGQVPSSLTAIDGYWSHWHGERAYSGVGVLVSTSVSPTPPSFDHPTFDFETRIATARMGELTVASVYVPNGGKDFPAKLRFLETLAAFAGEMRTGGLPFVLCGDLNVTRSEIDVHPKERKPTAIGQLPEERALLATVLDRGLVDLSRALAPDDDGLFTWWAPWRNMRARNIGWRIDYVLASTGLASRAVSCRVQREVGTSDHAPVIAHFA